MNQKQIKRIPRATVEREQEAERRKQDNENSLEVRYMLLLMEKHPDKARDAVRRMFSMSLSV